LTVSKIHGANGYLIDQFLHYDTNKRTDEYGETPENMSRFILEIIDACGKEIGYNKIGIRLSPAGHMNEIVTDPRDKFVFSHLLNQLSKLKIAYVHTGNFDDSIMHQNLDNKTMTHFIRSNYDGSVIASGGYNFDSASVNILQNECDLVALGRLFIANPDLILILKNNGLVKNYHEKMLSDDLY